MHAPVRCTNRPPSPIGVGGTERVGLPVEHRRALRLPARSAHRGYTRRKKAAQHAALAAPHRESNPGHRFCCDGRKVDRGFHHVKRTPGTAAAVSTRQRAGFSFHAFLAETWAEITKRPERRLVACVLAERVGFEPTVNLRSRLISSQVHSTTLPPLRDAHCTRVGRFTGRKNHSRSDCVHAPDKNNGIVRETGCTGADCRTGWLRSSRACAGDNRRVAGRGAQFTDNVFCGARR